jgi:phosphoribosylformimino-5-aminoimidazole carboxamide ribotide isomerase
VEIIPVIDLMGGIVVHARGGDRVLYPPLESILTQHLEAEKVIEDLLAVYPFKQFYLADLDAIFYQNPDLDLYHLLLERFPEITFWIDMGIQTQQQWRMFNRTKHIKPVIASETLKDLNLLKAERHSVLSLDFQYGEFLGEPDLWRQPDIWPKNIIVMNLDYIGAQAGPDIDLLQQVRSRRTDTKIFAAGGVRNKQDLIVLKQNRVAGVLIASALHNGNLSIETLKNFLNQ